MQVYHLSVARATMVSEGAVDDDTASGHQPVRLYEFEAWPDAVELPEVEISCTVPRNKLKNKLPSIEVRPTTI